MASNVAALQRLPAHAIELRVCDALSDRSIPDAAVFPASPSGEASPDQLLGTSSDEGYVSIDRAHRQVAIGAPGYQSRCVNLEELSDSRRIELHPGCGIRFDCRYDDGSPAPGVRIQLSSGVPLSLEHSGTEHPVFLSHQNIGVWSGTSNTGGSVRLNELRRGTVYLHASAPHAVASIQSPVEVDPSRTTIVPVTVTRLVGFRLRVLDSEVQAARWDGHHERYAACTPANIKLVSRHSYEQLLGRGGETVSDSWLPSPELPAPGDRLPVELLVEGGWAATEIEVQYLDTVVEKVLTASDVRTVPGATLSVNAPDVTGPITLVFPDRSKGVLRILTRHGKQLWLPYGDYRALDSHGRPCIPGGVFHFTPSGPAEATFGYLGNVPIDIAVRFEDGASPLFAFIDAAWRGEDGKVRHSKGTISRGRTSLLLPPRVPSVDINVRLFEARSWPTTLDLRTKRSHVIRIPSEIVE